MKLTLCVPLIWMLFSSAGALKCVQEDHRSNEDISKDPEPCNSPDVHCATVSYQEDSMKLFSIRRICAPSSLCNEGTQLFSMSYFTSKITASLHCCSTDGCNNKPIPFSAAVKLEPNGLQCFTCSPDRSCNQTLQCMGIADRCIAVDGTHRGVARPLHGCASSNLCEGHTEIKLKLLFAQYFLVDELGFTAPKCCRGSLCNSAPSDKLSVISIPLALVALSVLANGGLQTQV
ncbi:phospholipase A2 inhibitor 31 kDa subunit-like [Halichoeres trimaculatus]|uniref:phospholipase A2 inhibitor 31 kDa subunit-like n=1 Tax=Halichoeres trimaculatus TaxID=147232 RepID=UPI003D9EFA21